MKPAVMAPLYLAIYPELAEMFRKHGYALAVHGSMAKDFDLVAVPWAEVISKPQVVLKDLEQEFGIKPARPEPTRKRWDRQCFTVIAGGGTCYLDLSFVLVSSSRCQPTLSCQEDENDIRD